MTRRFDPALPFPAFRAFAHSLPAALIAFVLVPSAAFAKVDEARVELLVSIICQNGGSMETSQAAQILPSQGFTMDETQSIVAVLESRGLVRDSRDMSTLKLKRSACR